ncbi:MAG: DUF2161 family putative PD-(D/E)XK-type phosphodiesterase [Janthinobacterium lividum]
MSETSLYPAIKRFLATRGYDAKGEVGGCDIVATRPGEPPFLVIVELKLGLSLELVLQGVDRLSRCDEVWLAVPATRRGRDQDSRARKLCRLLGFGLLAVHAGGDVAVLAEPSPYKPRPNTKSRRALLAEHGRRRGDPSPGGTRGVPILTAYRQEALSCAARLRDGPLPTKALAVDSPRATAILYRNVYGWFERHSRGVYGLTAEGRAALLRWT